MRISPSGARPVIIFDCNGVLVDSEPLAAVVAAEEFHKVGFTVSAEVIGRYFVGRRTSDMLAAIEAATGARLPSHFPTTLTTAIVRRFRQELRATPHVEYALSWLRGPKCVASSSTLERVHAGLEATGLDRFFGSNLFSAADVARGKPAPDLYLHVARRMRVAPQDCIVVEDSPVGVEAATAAGMTSVGFIGGSHVAPGLEEQLRAAGARAVIVDMRALKGVVCELRGW